MDSSFIVLVPFFSIRPLTREEKKQNERKYARFQGHGKEKDLVYQNGKQGLKLCGFILNETIIVFVPKRAI